MVSKVFILYFTESEMKFMIELCRKYNKYISGGSDYHGTIKRTTHMATGITITLT